MSAREDVLRRHLDAENDHDLDAIMATYAADPFIVLNGHEIRGVEKVRLFHERFGFGGQGSFDHVNVAERKRHVTTDAIVIEQTLSGRHAGEYEGLAATGKRFNVAVCSVYRFNADGLLTSEDVYFDRARLRDQLR
jgi:steroid delta-isomerase-like uncharacterized protein